MKWVDLKPNVAYVYGKKATGGGLSLNYNIYSYYIETENMVRMTASGMENPKGMYVRMKRTASGYSKLVNFSTNLWGKWDDKDAIIAEAQAAEAALKDRVAELFKEQKLEQGRVLKLATALGQLIDQEKLPGISAITLSAYPEVVGAKLHGASWRMYLSDDMLNRVLVLALHQLKTLPEGLEVQQGIEDLKAVHAEVLAT